MYDVGSLEVSGHVLLLVYNGCVSFKYDKILTRTIGASSQRHHTKKNMNACEDSLELVTKAHVLAAIMTKLGMNELTDSFPIGNTPQTLRSTFLASVAGKIVSSFVDVSFTKSYNKIMY